MTTPLASRFLSPLALLLLVACSGKESLEREAPNAMAVTEEGKICVAGSAAENLGDFAVIRLERDGRSDATFGRSGKVTAVGTGACEGG